MIDDDTYTYDPDNHQFDDDICVACGSRELLATLETTVQSDGTWFCEYLTCKKCGHVWMGEVWVKPT